MDIRTMSLKLPRNWDFSTFKAETARIGMPPSRAAFTACSVDAAPSFFILQALCRLNIEMFSCKDIHLKAGGG